MSRLESTAKNIEIEPSGVTVSESLREALNSPKGARFYRCALQVNPFMYSHRHNKETMYATEAEYNTAIIEACKEHSIEVIGVTDHYRVQDSLGLVLAAREAGLFAFSGFEAVAKDGVHYLCLFDPDKDNNLERFIGECGIHDDKELSPIGSQDSLELLNLAKGWGGMCIAAHVAATGGGLLRKLSGKTRIRVWNSPNLLACALAGCVDDAPENLQPILANREHHHHRERPIAIINAQDVNGPEELIKPGASCFVKMSEISVEGLRQAFLDPHSRIRLHSDPQPESHVEFLSMAWEGGFLDGTRLHFNENLNVFVGGRGTGKSTIIESLRYVLGLDPLGEDAMNAHEGVIRFVLKSATKVSLLVRSHHPSQRCYTIERTIPNPAVVKDECGAVLTLTPQDIVPGVEVFGQHEISELTKSREKLTLLLSRFVQQDAAAASQKAKVKLELERSRTRILEVQHEIKSIEDQLAALPGLEETLKRFQEAGLEDRLKEKSQLIREERVLTIMQERLSPIASLLEDLKELTPIDIAFLSKKSLKDLPNAELLATGKEILERLSKKLGQITIETGNALKSASDELATLHTQWDELRKLADTNYEKLLRELHKLKIDGEEFIQLRRQIEGLRPLQEKLERLTRDLKEHKSSRRQLRDEWVNLQSAEFRALSRAAKKVTRKLRGRVQVKVKMAGNIEPLEKLLRRKVGGQLGQALERLKQREELSLLDLSDRCREGKEALRMQYGWPPAAAERVAQAGEDLFMEIEELDLPATTKIELNTAPEGAPEGAPEAWQTLEALSTGQKATAVLLLLLLESEAPLIIDQPEDDLDNRFITDGVVPTMKGEKRKRQFIFSTHNANIPVLGDAELILGLTTRVVNDGVHGYVESRHMGSIDAEPVREVVEEILEGGKAAFEMRRLKYGF
ncbi:MAG: AAA family ATPase [Gammaproteobacteria bacterium]|nr:AAA family ATPase [Gammaproteobacteria bacterium]